MKPAFILSQEDWSLHRKGQLDQQRHREKVREAIRDNLPDLITEESIIMSDGRQVVKIPIRSMEEYRFRYNYDKMKHAGQGTGNSKVGDVLARDSRKDAQGQGAGDQPGVDYYEAEVSVEELEDLLFSELALPRLKPKTTGNVTTEGIRFNDVRKKGLMGNIDKKRSILAAMRRNALKGQPGIRHISIDDLRFKTWEDVELPHSNAVVIAMMDTSGSMGTFEKYMARSFYFWMVRFLKTRYEKVDIVYIAHHTEAKEVSEEVFFKKGESGGTICSSAYRKALDVIEARYPPRQYNIYPFHFSDGDNLTSDNERCLRLVKELLDACNLFGYVEVNQYHRTSSLMTAFKRLDDVKFKSLVVKDNKAVYQALKTFFGKGETVAS